MKLISLIALCIWFSHSQAKECEVYGISDSPQRLLCTFKEQSLSLECDDATGMYYLGGRPVLRAFHYEVEEGSVPMVFKTKNKELIIIKSAHHKFDAQLEDNNLIFRGFCQ